jgi:hypothetical protein
MESTRFLTLSTMVIVSPKLSNSFLLTFSFWHIYKKSDLPYTVTVVSRRLWYAICSETEATGQRT